MGKQKLEALNAPTGGVFSDSSYSPSKFILECRTMYNEEVIFHYKEQFETNVYANNIGEFISAVKGLELTDDIVWTDSRVAYNWIKKGKPSSMIPMTPELTSLVIECVEFLSNNTSAKERIRKWNTNLWGQIPADFNRK